MSERPEIGARLDRLAAEDEVLGEGRVIARGSDGSRAVARAVLDAVDETILPAELHFASEEGTAALTLAAAGRRVRAVRAATDDLSPEGLVGGALDVEDEAALGRLASLLGRFGEQARGAVILREDRAAEGGAGGISAARLVDLLPDDVAAAPAAPAGPAGRFLADAGTRLTASLLLSPDGAEVSSGDDGLSETLAALSGLVPQEAAPSLVSWFRQTGPADGMAFGRALWTDGTALTMAFPASEAVALAAAFRATLDG